MIRSHFGSSTLSHCRAPALPWHRLVRSLHQLIRINIAVIEFGPTDLFIIYFLFFSHTSLVVFKILQCGFFLLKFFYDYYYSHVNYRAADRMRTIRL